MRQVRKADNQRDRVGPYCQIAEFANVAPGTRVVGLIVEGDEAGRLVSLRRLPLRELSKKQKTALTKACSHARTIRHPKIAATLDVRSENDEVLVASEYIDGATLRSLQRSAAMRKTPILPSVALTLIRELVDGLIQARGLWPKAKATAAPNLFGGITPESLFIASYGEALLTDVGLSAAQARIPKLLRHPATLPYRAPEVLAGETPNERSDIYSVGVIAWELFANAPLFGPPNRLSRPAETHHTTQSMTEWIADIQAGVAHRKDKPKLPDDLLLFTHRALNPEPQKRIQSLTRLREVLETFPASRFANGEELSKALENLAKSELQTRRTRVRIHAGGDFESSAPPSARATGRPQRPSEVPRVTIPEVGRVGNLLNVLGANTPEDVGSGIRPAKVINLNEEADETSGLESDKQAEERALKPPPNPKPEPTKSSDTGSPKQASSKPILKATNSPEKQEGPSKPPAKKPFYKTTQIGLAPMPDSKPESEPPKRLPLQSEPETESQATPSGDEQPAPAWTENSGPISLPTGGKTGRVAIPLVILLLVGAGLLWVLFNRKAEPAKEKTTPVAGKVETEKREANQEPAPKTSASRAERAKVAKAQKSEKALDKTNENDNEGENSKSPSTPTNDTRATPQTNPNPGPKAPSGTKPYRPKGI